MCPAALRTGGFDSARGAMHDWAGMRSRRSLCQGTIDTEEFTRTGARIEGRLLPADSARLSEMLAATKARSVGA